MKKTIILLAIILLGALFGFWFLQSESISKSPQTPLKIGINIWPGYAHAFVAQEKEFFNKHGALVELVLKPEISEINQLYNTGELDGLFNVFTDIIMFNVDGIPTRAVYIVDYSDTGDVIVGRSEFDSVKDLKGKTISFEGLGTFSQMFVLSLLQKAGIQEGEFKTVNLPAHSILEALETGQIDAGHTWEPTTSQAIEKDYKVLGKAGDIPGLITDVLAFHADVIEKRPQDVQGVVNAMLETRDFLYAHLDEALTIIAKVTATSKIEMEKGVKGVYHPDLKENIEAMQPGGTLFQSGEKTVDFYLKTGQLFKTPDLKTIIDDQFVQ